MWWLRLGYLSWLTLYASEYKAPSPPLPVSHVPLSGGPHFPLCLISISLSVLSALVSSSHHFPSLSFLPSLLSLSLPLLPSSHPLPPQRTENYILIQAVCPP